MKKQRRRVRVSRFSPREITPWLGVAKKIYGFGDLVAAQATATKVKVKSHVSAEKTASPPPLQSCSPSQKTLVVVEKLQVILRILSLVLSKYF